MSKKRSQADRVSKCTKTEDQGSVWLHQRRSEAPQGYRRGAIKAHPLSCSVIGCIKILHYAGKPHLNNLAEQRQGNKSRLSFTHRKE